MKLEVGMYARTKEGIIDKIIDITEEDHQRGEDEDLKPYKIYQIKQKVYDDEYDEYSDWLFADQFTKASNNIIDLIEEGDYVNGSEVMEADWINTDGEYEEGLAFPMYASDDLDVIENWLPLKSVPIKSIVTKEQFESMSYKIGE